MRFVRPVVMVLLVITGAAMPANRWLTTKAVSDPEHARLRDFLIALGPVTKPGEHITLVVPPGDDEEGTLAYRARYLLPGRYVTLTGERRLEPASAGENPQVVAYWHTTPPPGAQAVLDGFLSR